MTADTATPRWISQPYPAEGASAAEGIRNQLGRPALDLLTVLVREAAQNSWDARSDVADPLVRFEIDVRTVGPAHAHAWRTLLLEGGPRDTDHFPLRRSLTNGPLRILTVSDRGTKGLGGPTRADVVTDGSRDFVTFVRNVGEPRDTQLGGGTYGFGKGIFFMLSRPHAVLIHTRTEHEGRLQTRLIGSCLAHSYTESRVAHEKRYTGRHWWGIPDGGVAEPLVDDVADALVDRLGLQRFGPDETGTTIVVIDPEMDGILPDLEEIGPYLAETIMWQLWPKMLPRPDGTPAMEFRVTVDGRDHHVPDPESTLPLSLFAEAYRKLDGAEARAIERKRPYRRLGTLGLNDTWVPRWEPTRAAESAGFSTGLVHHICLMRNAELVVKYHALAEPQSEYKGYAGVFRAEASLDEVFAKSEPPTHDAWNPDSLPEADRSFVRSVFTRLREVQNEINGLHVNVKSSDEGIALGAASNYFSRLVRGSSGSGGRTAFEPGGGAGTDVPGGDPGVSGRGRHRRDRPDDGPGAAVTSRLRVDYVSEPSLTLRDNRPVLLQEFRLPPASNVRLRAELSIATAIDGTGRERELSLTPRVLGWILPDGEFDRTAEPVVQSDGDGAWHLVAEPPPDAMSVIEVRAEGERP